MRRTIPIVSGNIKYLGLSIPEWTMAWSPLPVYFIISKGNPICIYIHIVLIFFFIAFISKLEENIIGIIINNLNIPNIVQGFFVRPLPMYRKNDSNKQ
jgi:hypothetical protein